MTGKGCYTTLFEPKAIIEEYRQYSPKGKPLKNMLEFIKFEGQCSGTIEIKGTRTGSEEIVNEVTVNFNAGKKKSPVTIGIYDVKYVNKDYSYENKYKETVARVNTLVFKKAKGIPKMEVKIASIGGPKKSDGFLQSIAAVIANLLIKPIPITTTGNDAMLNFGRTITKKERTFVFPKAKNLKEKTTGKWLVSQKGFSYRYNGYLSEIIRDLQR